MACKLNMNTLSRVRPILRAHNVRFIMYRPRTITHSSSPIYMTDESMFAMAGVATQAAEVSRSIAVVNQTTLDNITLATYMVHEMVQVALMNVRKLLRLAPANRLAENDNMSLSPFTIIVYPVRANVVQGEVASPR